MQHAIRRLSALARDRRGSVTIITVGAMVAMLASTALAVDIGSIYLAQRKLQGVADIAAMAAVADTDSSTTAAQHAIDQNNLANAQIASLVPGTYTPDPSIQPSDRFVPSTPSPNAVQLTLSQSVPLFFGGALTGRSSAQVHATALAARMDYAAFSLGTRLAAVQGGLPGALLSALAGTDLNLSLMDYNALVGTQIDLLSFSKALATHLNLTAASFNDTLNAQATLPQILSALADVAGNQQAASTLNALALRVPPTTVQLSNLIDLGPYGGQDHSDPSSVVSADGYSIVRETLALANGTRQVSMNLGLSLPGISSTNVTLAIGQRPENSPWLTVAQDGTVTIRSAQARLYMDSQLLGTGLLNLASVHLPLYIELAEAQAKLNSISCHGQNNTTVGLNVLPSVGSVAIANVDQSKLSNFSVTVPEQQATIAQLGLLKVVGQAHTDLGGVNWKPVTFNSSDIANHTIQTVATDDLMQGVASSLVSKMKLTALGLDLSGITAAVGALLTPISPTLDGLVDQVTDLLGVHVGEADVQINGVRCGKPSLVA